MSISPSTEKRRKPILSPHKKLIEHISNYFNVKQIDVPENIIHEIPKKWQKYDDMIIFSECFENQFWTEALEQEEFWQMIATTLGGNRVAILKRIQCDGYRTPVIQVKYGLDSAGEAVVHHTENGITYCWDVTSLMFSKGNATEKFRVGKFNCAGETVVDLFAGIGYFTLPYILKANAAHVIACEWNQKAIQFLKKNLNLNNVASSRYTVLSGDNRMTCPIGLAQRVNLGLIPSSCDSWETACRAIDPSTGAYLHIHENVESPNNSNHDDASISSSSSSNATSCSFSCNKKKCKPSWSVWAVNAKSTITTLLNNIWSSSTGWNVEIKHIEHVKQYGPRVDHLVLDLYCHCNAGPSPVI